MQQSVVRLPADGGLLTLMVLHSPQVTLRYMGFHLLQAAILFSASLGSGRIKWM